MKLRIYIARRQAETAVMFLRETDSHYHEPAKSMVEPGMKSGPVVVETEIDGDGHEFDEIVGRWFFR